MSLEYSDIVSIVLYSIFSVLVLFSNSIIIIVIIKSRELHRPTLWNIAVMAAWDLTLALHSLVFIVPSKILNEFAYPDTFGRFSSQLMSVILLQNGFNIMLALIDRYISICWPLHYPRLMSAKRFAFAIIILLLGNVIRVSTLYMALGQAVIYNKSLGYFLPVHPSVSTSVTGGISLAVTFIIICLLIRIRVERGRKINVNTGSQETGSTQFTYTMYVSTLVCIACYMPMVITTLVDNVRKTESNLMKQIGMVCVVSNSLWNVFIYAATYRPFRDAFLKLFCPTNFRERARREMLVQFRRNQVSVFTVE